MRAAARTTTGWRGRRPDHDRTARTAAGGGQRAKCAAKVTSIAVVNSGELAAAVQAAVVACIEAGEFTATRPGEVVIERPKNRTHGDYATNIALRLAKGAGRSPREVAEAIAGQLRGVDGIGAVDVAGPGFLNITLAAGSLGGLARTIVEAGATYGRGDSLAGRRINLEFVSANPTGPLTLPGTRWAAAGDALARILAASGAAVTREYYVNDHGAQIDRFAESLLARAHGEPTPADGYPGEYVDEIAASVVEAEPGVLDLPRDEAQMVFRRDGVQRMFAEIKASLHDLRVDFDVFFSETSLYESGAVDKAVEQLKQSGALYAADGAWWLRSTEFGDDKDRVVIKSDGNAAYIAGDIAYIADKRARGFDLCMFLLGADHHGYVGRLKAALAALGDDPEVIEVLIGQIVRLVKDGKPARMGKRTGNIITMDDLVDLVGVDAARYSLERGSIDSALDVDVDLLVKRTNDNPVFYVQYAHARLSSLQRNASELGIARTAEPDLALLTHEREVDLLGALGEFPRIVASAAELRAPHRVARYLEELAGVYHRFYDACRVLPQGDERPTALTDARLWLCEATRVVLANGLELLGVSAPERM
jgi:arginyl-tRNA synthetase